MNEICKNVLRKEKTCKGTWVKKVLDSVETEVSTDISTSFISVFKDHVSYEPIGEVI